MSHVHELRVMLTDEQNAAIQAAIASGEYSSPEQIVQATLEDWKWQREWLRPEHTERLRELWREGKESGDPQPLDLEEVRAEARRRGALGKDRAA